MCHDDAKKPYCDEAVAEAEEKRPQESGDVQRDRLLESMLRHGASILRCFSDLLNIEANEISDENDCSAIQDEIAQLQRRLKRMRAQ